MEWFIKAHYILFLGFTSFEEKVSFSLQQAHDIQVDQTTKRVWLENAFLLLLSYCCQTFWFQSSTGLYLCPSVVKRLLLWFLSCDLVQ